MAKENVTGELFSSAEIYGWMMINIFYILRGGIYTQTRKIPKNGGISVEVSGSDGNKVLL